MLINCISRFKGKFPQDDEIFGYIITKNFYRIDDIMRLINRFEIKNLTEGNGGKINGKEIKFHH
jgi:hypothetical protein